MKEMVYQSERKVEVLEEGVYQNVPYAILNLGTHPTAYVENIVGVADYDSKKLYDIDVHCGFTYCGEAYWDKQNTKTYLGWDYAHAGDFVGYYSGEESFSYSCKKWTLEEIRIQVHRVIKQLLEVQTKDE